MRRNSKGKSKGDGGSQKQQQAKVGVWVWAQCDNDRCQKWRKLPPGTVVDSNEPWFCYLNPNEDRNACELSEESYNEETEAAVYMDETSDEETSSLHQDSPAWQQKSTQKWSRSQNQANGKASGSLSRKRSLQPRFENGHADRPPTTAKRQRGSGGSQAVTPEPSGTQQSQGVPPWGSSNQAAEEGLPEPGFSGRQAGAWYPEETSDLGALDPRDGGARGGASQRGLGKARKAHTGFNKLLATGGVWEIVKGKGRAVTALPMWVWEGLSQHAPEAAQLACQAADYSSAARYFEISQARRGPEQAQEAAAAARLAMTAAAAMAVQSTGDIPGIADSPPSGSGAAEALPASPQLPAAEATSQLQPWPGNAGQLAVVSAGQSLYRMPQGALPGVASTTAADTSTAVPAQLSGPNHPQSLPIYMPPGQLQLPRPPQSQPTAIQLQQAVHLPGQLPGQGQRQFGPGPIPPVTIQQGSMPQANPAAGNGPSPGVIPNGVAGHPPAAQLDKLSQGAGIAQSLSAQAQWNGRSGYVLPGPPNGWTVGGAAGTANLPPQIQQHAAALGGKNGYMVSEVAGGGKGITGAGDSVKQPHSSLAGLAQDLASRNSWAPSVSQAGPQ